MSYWISRDAAKELTPPQTFRWNDGVVGVRLSDPADSLQWGVEDPMSHPEVILTGERPSLYYGAYGIVVDMNSVRGGGRPESAPLAGTAITSERQALSVGDPVPGFDIAVQSILVRASAADVIGDPIAQPGPNPFDTFNGHIMASHAERYPQIAA